MAKKKTSHTNGKQPSQKPSKKPRAPKERSQRRTPQGIRALAAEVREVAERLDEYARTMQALDIASIRPLTGNFHQALERIRVFTAQQVLAKLMVAAERAGKDAHQCFVP